MPWGVDDVDFVATPVHGAVFGEDGDTSFSFEFVVVHEEVANLLVVAEGFGGFEHFVDKSCLAVVDVRDNCDVTDFGAILGY